MNVPAHVPICPDCKCPQLHPVIWSLVMRCTAVDGPILLAFCGYCTGHEETSEEFLQ